MNWLKSNGCSLAVGITSKRYGDDRVLAMEPVTPSDLLSARDQAWWDGLRAGAIGFVWSSGCPWIAVVVSAASFG